MEALLLAVAVALAVPVQDVRQAWPASPWASYQYYAPAKTTRRPARESKRKVALARTGEASTRKQPGPLNPAGMERSTAECRAKWNLVDPHGYGILFGRELASARPMVPIVLADRDYLTIEDYLSACSEIVATNQRG